MNVTDKPPLDEIDSVQEAIRKVETELAGEGRVLVRYSGTQSMCRVMVEGPTKAKTETMTDLIVQAVQAELGES